MIERHKMRFKQIKPISNLLKDRFMFEELVLTEKINKQHIGQVVDLLFVGIQPNVIMREDNHGCWHINSGAIFIQAIVEYMQDYFRYPLDGCICEFQGKLFSELPKMEQRKIREFQISILLYEQDKTDNDLEFERLTTVAKELT